MLGIRFASRRNVVTSLRVSEETEGTPPTAGLGEVPDRSPGHRGRVAQGWGFGVREESRRRPKGPSEQRCLLRTGQWLAQEANSSLLCGRLEQEFGSFSGVTEQLNN